MKKTPGFGSTPQGSVPPGAFTSADKKKLVIMTALLVVVGFAYLWSLFGKEKAEADEHAKQMQNREAIPEETIYVPEFDFAALNDELDESEDGQLRLERAPLERVLNHAALLTGTHYTHLDTLVLDEDNASTLLDDTTASRGRPVRIRGDIEALVERRRADGNGAYQEGRLRLEDGSVAYFCLTELPEDDEGPAGVDTFVRINGLFFKTYRSETDRGWETGPMIVARNAVFSYPSVGDRVTELPPLLFELVPDDSVIDGPGVPPFEAYWTLLAYARDLEEGAVDWSTVPELDNLALAELLKDGKQYRAQPFRIPICKNMGTRQLTIPENPARVEKITQGWIGNQTWTSGNGLMKFEGAFEMPELRDGDLITARGFFFRNHLYEPSKGGAALAPFFVLTDLERFVPEESRTVQDIFMFVVGLTVALIALFFFLLTRDKKKSLALQEDLVRRRRERRERQAATGTAAPEQA